MLVNRRRLSRYGLHLPRGQDGFSQQIIDFREIVTGVTSPVSFNGLIWQPGDYVIALALKQGSGALTPTTFTSMGTVGGSSAYAEVLYREMQPGDPNEFVYSNADVDVRVGFLTVRGSAGPSNVAYDYATGTNAAIADSDYTHEGGEIVVAFGGSDVLQLSGFGLLSADFSTVVAPRVSAESGTWMSWVTANESLALGAVMAHGTTISTDEKVSVIFVLKAASAGPVDRPGTITSDWSSWTATAIGTVNTTQAGSIASNWGTWTATAVGTRSTSGSIASSWGTWTATASATVNHPATVASSCGGR